MYSSSTTFKTKTKQFSSSGTFADLLVRHVRSRGLERKDARPRRRRHLARHRLFRKCAVGVLYSVADVRSRNAPAQKERNR